MHQAVVEAGQPQAAVLRGDLAVHQAGLPGPLADVVAGTSPSSSRWPATGMISLRVKSRAVWTSCSCSSVMSKPIMAPGSYLKSWPIRTLTAAARWRASAARAVSFSAALRGLSLGPLLGPLGLDGKRLAGGLRAPDEPQHECPGSAPRGCRESAPMKADPSRARGLLSRRRPGGAAPRPRPGSCPGHGPPSPRRPAPPPR